MRTLQVPAYAKINLTLDVLGKRPDGYHDLTMVMQSVSLADTVTLSETEEPEFTLSTNLGFLPGTDKNIAAVAARVFAERTGVSLDGLHIHLDKRIPVCAGTAGGSSDGAAVLRALNHWFYTGLPLPSLAQMGEAVGSDVPYCVLGGTALAEGIGEKLTSLNPAPDCYVLVAKPPINVSTKYVYEHLDAEGIEEHPDIDGMVEAIWEESLQGILDRMGNVLENVTEKKYPVIAELKNKMKELGALNSLMSGSGPTVFGIFIDERIAREAFEALKKEKPECQVFLTGFY